MRYMISSFLLALALTFPMAGAHAAEAPEAEVQAEVPASPFMIEKAVLRPTIGPVRRSAGYFTLHNHGEADRLTGAELEGAGNVELHTHIKEGEVMKMRRIESAEVPANGMLIFKHRAHHLMIFDLEGPLKEGMSVDGALIFEKAGRVPVTFSVMKPDLSGGTQKDDGMKHHGSGH
jgi:hypothetical protein